jgi:hypothetical protein
VDRSRNTGDQALDTRDAVAGKGKRKRRKRTTAEGTVRRINAKARDRQRAWLETGRRNDTERLTRELNGSEDSMVPEGLYAELRDVRKGDARAPFRGRTWSAR